MTLPSLIAISGFARAGKDETANIIISFTGDRYVKHSFARPIKDACNLIFGWDVRHSDGDLKEVVDPYWGVSPRVAYQTLGTEWGRALINQDLWLMHASRYLESRRQQGKGLIIPDLRFPNELAWVKKEGGLHIHIDAGLRARAKMANEAHSSELYVAEMARNADHLIVNDSTLKALRLAVSQILNPEPA